MAQFDVHRNSGPLKDAIPFVVVVQSAQFDCYRRRVVVPLVRKNLLSADTPTADSRMNPVSRVGGMDVVLHQLDMVPVAVDRQEGRSASLAEQGQATPMRSTSC